MAAAMTPQQAELVERLLDLLADEPSTREVSMFGCRAMMVNEKMVSGALKNGDLLVRVPSERHERLTAQPGATEAEMGAGRTMGPGWITVSAGSIRTEEALRFWLDIALEHNRTAVRGRR